MTLQEIKKLIEQGRYRFSQKIYEFIEEGLSDPEDLEQCILTAQEVQKRERDEQKEAIHRLKFTILGVDTCGLPFYTVGKVCQGPDGQYYFFITAHQADERP